jgi:hypothetical protein
MWDYNDFSLNPSTQNLSVAHTSIPDGLDDIAMLMGVTPADTVFDYNVTARDEKRPDPSRGVIQQGVACLARKHATAVTLRNQPAVRGYWEEHLNVRNICEVTNHLPSGNDFTFPNGDVYQHLRKAGKEVTNLMRGKLFVAHTSTPETDAVVRSLGASLLMSPDQSRTFNSKVRTATQALEYGYTVSPNTIVWEREGVVEGFNKVCDIARNEGLEPDTTKYWIRFDRLSAGIGVFPKPAETSFEAVKEWIDHTVKESLGGQFVPLVIDIDIGHLPGVRRIVDNLNVQGVCGNAGSFCVGVTRQITDNGKYMGGELPNTPESVSHAQEAIRWGMPVMEAAQKQGYRGFAGIDVMLAEMNDGSHRGYILEMNGRLNSSTSLLSLSHSVAREMSLPRSYAKNIVHDTPSLSVEHYLTVFDDFLYKGGKSGFAGLIPIIFYPDPNGNVARAKTVAVAPTPEDLKTLQRRVDHVTAGLRFTAELR